MQGIASYRRKSISQSEDFKVASPSGKMQLLLIFLTVFIDLVGFGLVIPILPTYAQQLHASETTVGWLIASYSIMQFFFIPFWGKLSDRIGRRPVLLISLATSCIGYLIWGFADTLLWLFVSRIVAGFGNANIAVAQAYISDVTSEENRAKGMGLIGAAFGLGFVLGPALGILCLNMSHDLKFVGLVAAGFSLIDLILTAFMLPEPKERGNFTQERFGRGISFVFNTLGDSKLRISFLIFYISTFAFANMESTLVLLTAKQFHWDARANSTMFLYIGFWIIMVQGGLIRRLTKKNNEKRLIAMGSLLTAIGLLMLPLGANLTLVYVALALLAIGSGINNPCNQSLLSKLAPQDHVGGVLGVGQSVSTLGRILGPIIGCYLFEHTGYMSPYFAAGACMLVAMVLSFMLPNLGAKAPETNAEAPTAA